MSHSTVIGKDLLHSLMFSLYPEPETIYREYLQNACDSINEAVNTKVLNDYDDGRVIVRIEQNKSKVIISDNGVGILSKDAERNLKDVAKSSKKGKDYAAGFFGIGRLVGAGYCRELVFETSAFGEAKVSKMIFDVDHLREILRDSDNDLTAAEALDEITTFSIEKESKDEHYFRVVLNDILPEYESLLDEELIYKYLRQVAPVAYMPEFKNNLIRPALGKQGNEEYRSYYKALNTINISLNEMPNIKKPYGLTVDGTGDAISELRFFTLKNHRYGNLAWGWYAVTPFSTQIPDKDEKTGKEVLTRGVRLRVHNIQIGNQNFFDGTNYFKQARSNKYFNGEIHVLNPSIKPTTDRSNLEPSPEAQALNAEIVKFFNEEMQKVYQDANKVKKEVERLIKTEQEILNLQENNVSEKSSKFKALKEDQKRQQESVNKIFEKKENQNPGQEAMRGIYQEKINKFKKFTPQQKKEVKVNVPNLEPKNMDIKEEINNLLPIYGKEKIDMLKKIFKIIDIGWKNSESTVRTVKSLVIKGLKSNNA